MSDRAKLVAEVARTQHAIVRSFRQSGNDYREEVECSCGQRMYATRFENHRARAALAAYDAEVAAPVSGDGDA